MIKIREDVTAACFIQPGEHMLLVGPVVALDAEPAKVVFQASAFRLPRVPLAVDVPDSRADFAGWLLDAGFVRQRGFVRMVYGNRAPAIGRQSCVFADGRS